jgi:hypothetical protein
MRMTIQHHFQSYLVGPILSSGSPISSGLSGSSELLKEERNILNHISTTGLVSPTKGINIYFNAYRSRLIEILANDFPKLRQILGEKKFNAMADEYLKISPSKSYSVRYFGQSFADFLKSHPSFAKKPYFAEMATFEWMLGDAIDAKDAALFTLETLKEIPASKWNEMKICFHPSVQMLRIYWNTTEVWQALENESQDIPKWSKRRKPNFWIILRSDLQTAFRSMEKDEAFALELVHQNNTFGEICEKLCDRMPEEKIPLFVLTCLQSWIQEGLISQVL